jgi:hypothetical protein
MASSNVVFNLSKRSRKSKEHKGSNAILNQRKRHVGDCQLANCVAKSHVGNMSC